MSFPPKKQDPRLGVLDDLDKYLSGAAAARMKAKKAAKAAPKKKPDDAEPTDDKR